MIIMINCYGYAAELKYKEPVEQSDAIELVKHRRIRKLKSKDFQFKTRLNDKVTRGVVLCYGNQRQKNGSRQSYPQGIVLMIRQSTHVLSLWMFALMETQTSYEPKE